MPVTATIPRLEPGDHLDRAEFHRRYEAMPDVRKAELLDGVVYVPSPPTADHAEPQSMAAGWLAVYAAATPGVQFLLQATVLLGAASEVQPGALVRIAGPVGRSRLSESRYVTGPPELIVEVARSSASYDVNLKRDVYERVGVQEYVAWRVRDAAIDWWALETGGRGRGYVALEPDAGGLLHSLVLPGLVLDSRAMVEGNLARALEVQQSAIGGGAHVAFRNMLNGQ